MDKLKGSGRVSILNIIVNVAIGHFMWLIIACVFSWLVLTKTLDPATAVIIAPFTQGVIIYVITMVASIEAKRGARAIALLTPGVYMFIQLITALLFWKTSLGGIVRGILIMGCGGVLALITQKLKKNNRRPRFAGYSR